MKITPLKTRNITSTDSWEDILNESVISLKNGVIVAITSKVVSIIEGRLVAKEKHSKDDLINRESDDVLLYDHPQEYPLTIKNGRIVVAAGIDESNVGDHYILYPTHPFQSAEKIWTFLRNKHQLSELGVIITDSNIQCLRRGVTGICLSWCGFKPLFSYIGEKDLHGNPLKVTQVNILDALATAAVFVMGEGNEQTPIATIEDMPRVSFVNRAPTLIELNSVSISAEEDLYEPFLKSHLWKSQITKKTN